MTINIEITASPSAQALADIHAASFAKGWNAASIKETLGVKGTMAFVAQDGFGLLRLAGDECEMLTLAVLPACRKKGIGKALVGAMCKWAQTHGAKTLFLEVRQSNEVAFELYTKMGFSVLSQRKDYYRDGNGDSEHATVMRILL